jgi:hypothetical protein
VRMMMLASQPMTPPMISQRMIPIGPSVAPAVGSARKDSQPRNNVPHAFRFSGR